MESKIQSCALVPAHGPAISELTGRSNLVVVPEGMEAGNYPAMRSGVR